MEVLNVQLGAPELRSSVRITKHKDEQIQLCANRDKQQIHTNIILWA